MRLSGGRTSLRRSLRQRRVGREQLRGVWNQVYRQRAVYRGGVHAELFGWSVWLRDRVRQRTDR
jgi:hypothetical protein